MNSTKASYNKTFQYLHLVSNSTVGLPTDVWLPVDNNIRPREADQIALGYFQNLGKKYSFSVEGYYKAMHQVIDYRDNADIFLNENIETQLRTGFGQAYGVEFLFEKKKGRLQGWLSYTLSRVERTINGVNNNKTYAPRYDRRHNLSLIATYELSSRWQLSMNYAYISGAGITVPQGIYSFSEYNAFNYYSERNAFKLPDFHQLDLSAKLRSKKRKKWQGEWVFGLTNAYNRKNTFTYYLAIQQNEASAQAYKMYLFGLMPAISYNFKF